MTTAIMGDSEKELNALFAPATADSLAPDVLGELQSVLRIHATTPQELSYKWESYTMKMDLESTNVTLENVRAFKKDMQEALERESRAKASRSTERKGHATPRGGAFGDTFGMYVTSTCSSEDKLSVSQA